MNHAERREHILKSAVRVAERVGYFRITRRQIATEAEVSDGLVQHHFHNQETIREAVLKEAIRTENLQVVGQAAVLKNSDSEIPAELAARAVRFIMEGNG